jgi:ubiquinone/menaquinone biosynthesis C-methylase UbiE
MEMSDAERNKYKRQSTKIPKFERLINEHTWRAQTVLDVGCGDGAIVKKYLPLCDRIFAIDNDQRTLIAFCDSEASLSPKIDVLLGDLDRLPFEAEFFDAIFCRGVLRHCHDPSLALSELSRVLKPDGELYVMDVFCNPNTVELFRVLSYFRTASPKWYWTYNQFIRLLRNKFRVERIVPFEYETPITDWTQPTGLPGLEAAGHFIGLIFQDQGVPSRVAGLPTIEGFQKQLKSLGVLIENNLGMFIHWDMFEMLCLKS